MVKRWSNDGRNGGAGAGRRAGIAAIGVSKTMPVRHLWIGTPASGFCGESKCAVFLFFEINFVGFLLRSKNSSYLCIVVSKVLSDVIYCKSNPKAYCLR